MQITRTQNQPNFKSVHFRDRAQLVNYARNREFARTLKNAERAAQMPATLTIQYTPTLAAPFWVSCTKDHRQPLVNRIHRQNVPMNELHIAIDDAFEEAEKEHCSPSIQNPIQIPRSREKKRLWELMSSKEGIVNTNGAHTMPYLLDKNSISIVIDQLRKIETPRIPFRELFLGFNDRREAPFSVGCLRAERCTATAIKGNLQAHEISEAMEEVVEQASRQAFATPLVGFLPLTREAKNLRHEKINALDTKI